MNLSAVISQLAALFLMILAGYISARADLISPQFRQKLSSLALNTAAPCIILSSVLESESGRAIVPPVKDESSIALASMRLARPSRPSAIIGSP